MSKALTKKYQIIYADPPWRYENQKGNEPSMGGITYSTLSVEEICNFSIKEIAAENCLLFCWATMPMLQEALTVISAWGFRYRTCAFVWVKQNQNGKGIYSGLGHWTNGNAELCLLGKKGHPKRYSKNIKQIVLAPVSKHSRKPVIIRDMIVRLAGDLPRIELFARNQEPMFSGFNTTDGWDIWGNEVASDIELQTTIKKQ